MDQLSKDQEASSQASLSNAIDQIMAHPELISMVASALGGAAEPREASPPPEAESVSPSPSTASLSALTPLLASLSKAKDKDTHKERDPRAALLCALKPYLSMGRQEAIDYMIRISQISDLLKHLT